MKDSDSKQQKIQMWKDKMAALQKEYELIMHQRGEAAAMGDLGENAAYQMLTEQGEVLSARIGDMQKMIKDLEGDSADETRG